MKELTGSCLPFYCYLHGSSFLCRRGLSCCWMMALAGLLVLEWGLYISCFVCGIVTAASVTIVQVTFLSFTNLLHILHVVRVLFRVDLLCRAFVYPRKFSKKETNFLFYFLKKNPLNIIHHTVLQIYNLYYNCFRTAAQFSGCYTVIKSSARD